MNNPKNISQAEFERIESYLMQSMPNSEVGYFEKELVESQEFAQKVQEVKALVDGIEESALREIMDGFHQQLDDNRVLFMPKRRSNTLLAPIFIAASILLLIGLFSWLVLFRPNAEEQLFMAYFQPDPGLVTAMGSSMEYEFDRGMVDYKMGEYAAAIQRWENLIREKPENDTLHYFLGAAHLGLKNADSAERYFEKAVSMGSRRFTEDAYWYLGLTRVLKGDFEKARSILEKSNHPEKDKLIENLQKK